MTTEAGAQAPPRPPFWRDLRVLRVLGQAAVLALVIALFAFMWSNLQANADAGRIPPPTDLSYLDQPFNQSIPGSDFRPTQSRLDALVVGFVRTVQIAVIGIILCTILGVLLGIARLSTNWLASRFALLYVEVFRNTPPLVVIIFIYTGLFLNSGLLPGRGDETFEIPGLLTADLGSGIAVPWIAIDGGVLPVLAVLLVAAIAWWLVARWRQGVQDRTGAPSRKGLWGAGAFLLVAIVGWLALGGPVTGSTPELTESGRPQGGYLLRPEYAALLLGLVLYTASHVAEITRAAIQAVPKGQTEASQALGLNPAQRLQRIILPQAMRIAIPPLANQYLNLMKNSSLAVAIAYVELTKLTRDMVNNGAPAFQAFLMLALIYLVISLAISLVTNLINSRLAVPGQS